MARPAPQRVQIIPLSCRKDMKRDRALIPLARSDILLSMVQIFRGGGDEQECP